MERLASEKSAAKAISKSPERRSADACDARYLRAQRAPPFPSPSGRGPTSAAVCARGVRGCAPDACAAFLTPTAPPGIMQTGHSNEPRRHRLLLLPRHLPQTAQLREAPQALRPLLNERMPRRGHRLRLVPAADCENLGNARTGKARRNSNAGV